MCHSCTCLDNKLNLNVKCAAIFVKERNLKQKVRTSPDRHFGSIKTSKQAAKIKFEYRKSLNGFTVELYTFTLFSCIMFLSSRSIYLYSCLNFIKLSLLQKDVIFVVASNQKLLALLNHLKIVIISFELCSSFIVSSLF